MKYGDPAQLRLGGGRVPISKLKSYLAEKLAY